MRILSFDLGDFNADSAWKLLDDDSGEVASGTVLTTEQTLCALLQRWQPTVVLCEACTMTSLLYDAVQAVLPTCVLHAANTNADAWRWSQTRCKTDAKDCERLIKLFRVGELATVYIPTAHERAFRRAIMHRGKLVERRTSAYNGIRAACKRHQVSLPSGEAAWTKKGLEFIESLVAPVEETDAHITLRDARAWLCEVADLLAQVRLLNKQIARVEKVIDRELAQRPEVPRIRSAPGYGPVLASVLLAFIGDPRRFSSGKQVASYAGLVPRVYQSGKSERMGRITKAGNVRLRKLLINAAWIAVRNDPWAKQTFERLTGGSRNRTRRKIAIVAVARRLLIRSWAMMRDGTTWRSETPATAA